MLDDEKEIKNKFGYTLRILRNKRDFSQEYIAEKTNLHRTYISDVERGDRNISLINIERICNALDIKASLFFQCMEGVENHETES